MLALPGRANSYSSASEGILKTKFALAVVFCVSSVFAQQPPSGAAAASAFIESSMEVRFQLDLKVPDEVLKPYLPEGFTSSVAAQGPAKDCNVRLIFTDRVTVNGSEGKPIG